MRDHGYLPHILAAIAEVAGEKRALALADALGGQRIKIPFRMSDDHRLVQILGRDGADRLAELYAGDDITIPFGPAGSRVQARRRMAQALAEGASINEAVRRSGLHHRTGQRLRKRMRQEGSQGSLF